MSFIVMKFGGASVSDENRLSRVAQIIVNSPEPAVVVVSAQKGRTDQLVSDMRAVNSTPSSEVLDVLLCVGEMQSAALLAAMVEKDRPAQVVPPWTILRTDKEFGDASIQAIRVQPILDCLARGAVPIVPGFIGETADGRITTLGRGGSDYTAVAIGAALPARRVELYKAEVDGIYDVDPNKHANARQFADLTHAEAMYLAQNGAKVLHDKAAALAQQYQVPLLVRSTFGHGPGTTIGCEPMSVSA